MLNKLLICLLILLSYLYAENGWSEPVLLSPPNIMSVANPYIIMDRSNKLYAFWSTIYKNTYYCVSSDGGQSWGSLDSTSASQSDQPIAPKVVCDSNNNLHLFYQHLYSGKYMYQKRVNGQWSQPQMLVDYVGSGDKVITDNNDNIYVLWFRQGSLLTYYKIIYANNNWSPEKVIKNYVLFDVSYNGGESLHLAGSNEISLTSLNNKAHYLKYNIVKDSIVKITDISNNLKPSQAFAIGSIIPDGNQIFTALNVGASGDTASTWYSKQEDNNWLLPGKLNMKTYFRGKQILVDSGNNPHIFDMGFHLDTLFHYRKNATGWETEKVVCNTYGDDYWINGYKALIANDYIYIIYNWTATGQNSRIYFTQKKINVGVEENTQTKTNNIELTNYPNPFNNTTQISLILPQISDVKLEIFNIKGEMVKLLANSKLKSGKHKFNFNAMALNSGVFYCRVTTGAEVKTTKLMLLK